ncbi:helix-turn-helix domain-containing protein [Streptomyces sp. NPDC002004]
MHQPSAQPTPPFNALAARRFRESLGMAPGHVAYGMRASYGMTHISTETIIAWERGHASPTSAELTALAGSLWCAPGELIRVARTLREHRMARGIAPEDVAHAIGVDLATYLTMEDSGKWRGNERQSAALAGVLGLSLPDFAHVTGRDGQLAELLRSAVTVRWQGYVRPIAKLLPMEKRKIQNVLERLHADYQSGMVATLAWTSTQSSANESSDAGRDFLDRIVDHFWATAGERGA